MKTIIHLVLSNEERSHLANWIDGKYNKRLVSRDEVTLLCKEHITGLLQGGANGKPASQSIPIRRPSSVIQQTVDSGKENGVSDNGDRGTTKKGTLPTATELTAAIGKVLEHIALNTQGDNNDMLNMGWCCSILVAAGVG